MTVRPLLILINIFLFLNYLCPPKFVVLVGFRSGDDDSGTTIIFTRPGIGKPYLKI